MSKNGHFYGYCDVKSFSKRDVLTYIMTIVVLLNFIIKYHHLNCNFNNATLLHCYLYYFITVNNHLFKCSLMNNFFLIRVYLCS